MSFFDSTPIGRVINRFSKDLDDIDVQLPAIFEQLLQNLLLIVTSIAVISYAIPFFLVAVPFILVFYIWLVRYFRPTQREAKRLDNLSRSPLFSQLTGRCWRGVRVRVGQARRGLWAYGGADCGLPPPP